jgi:hypothetical protein
MFAAGGLTPPETQATKEAPASPRWGFSLPVPRGGDGRVQGELGARPFMKPSGQASWSDAGPLNTQALGEEPLRRLPDTKNGFVGKQSGALATAQHGVSSSLSKLSVDVPLDGEDGAGAVSERCDEADWETDDGEHDTTLNFRGYEGVLGLPCGSRDRCASLSSRSKGCHCVAHPRRAPVPTIDPALVRKTARKRSR